MFSPNRAEDRAKYKEWLKSLKVGDVVVYPGGTAYAQSRHKSKIKKITLSGRFRLEDGTLWYHHGGGMGRLGYRHLMPYTEEVQEQEARSAAIGYLKRFRDWNHLSSEDLLEILNIVKKVDKVDKADS